MTKPAKLQNAKFNFVPSDADCEACGSTTDVFTCDSDFGPLTVDLCLACTDADYDPAD